MAGLAGRVEINNVEPESLIPVPAIQFQGENDIQECSDFIDTVAHLKGYSIPEHSFLL